MKEFTIYPAIDLRNGMVVRLKYGDPKQQTIFSNDGSEIANRWQSLGARWLHVINLDGAFEESDQTNQRAINEILAACKLKNINIQLGGGIRTMKAIESTLALGVNRVILGTVAVQQPELVKTAVQRFGKERIVVAVDARDGFVAVRGWKEDTKLHLSDFVMKLEGAGIKTIIYTDINRDGVGGGINLKNTATLAQQSSMEVIASGGIFNLDDVKKVKEAGIPGVVIGRALYAESIDPVKLFQLQESR
jgi:phosphoribosylformimino-5-aminoimidazole carboxamide ribotide isomerase